MKRDTQETPKYPPLLEMYHVATRTTPPATVHLQVVSRGFVGGGRCARARSRLVSLRAACMCIEYQLVQYLMFMVRWSEYVNTCRSLKRKYLYCFYLKLLCISEAVLIHDVHHTALDITYLYYNTTCISVLALNHHSLIFHQNPAHVPLFDLPHSCIFDILLLINILPVFLF